VAVVLSDFLKRVIQATEPWLSKDITAGARWRNDLASALATTKFGIVCVTRENQSSPWMNFEAGALAKTVSDAHVCPYLIDLAEPDLKPPLSEFQAKGATEKDTLELVQSVNATLGLENSSARLSEEVLQDAFKAHWPMLKNALDSPPELPSPVVPRDPREIAEETLETVRSLSRALADIDRLLKSAPFVVSLFQPGSQPIFHGPGHGIGAFTTYPIFGEALSGPTAPGPLLKLGGEQEPTRTLDPAVDGRCHCKAPELKGVSGLPVEPAGNLHFGGRCERCGGQAQFHMVPGESRIYICPGTCPLHVKKF